MTVYWCRFMDSTGRVVAAEKLMGSDDAEAVSVAAKIDVRRNGFELWDGRRRVTSIVQGLNKIVGFSTRRRCD